MVDDAHTSENALEDLRSTCRGTSARCEQSQRFQHHEPATCIYPTTIGAPLGTVLH